MVESKKKLHKVVPYGVFWDGAAVTLSLFDDGGQIASATIFHEDVEHTGVAVDVSVVVAHNVFMLKVLEDISEFLGVSVVGVKRKRGCAHFGDDLFSIPFCHSFKVEFLSRENLEK